MTPKSNTDSKANKRDWPDEESEPPYYQDQDLQVAAVFQEEGALPSYDGRIEIHTNSRLFRTLSRAIDPKTFQKQSAEAKTARDPPPYTEHPPINLNLNIVIQVVGSRGDVQPFIALGTELLRHGHRIRLATHNCFADLVLQSGLEFYPIGGDPVDLMAYMVKNPGLIPSMKSLQAGDIQKKRKMIAEMLNGCWQSCIMPDMVSQTPFVAEAIIANPPSFAHIHCAQALGIPVHMVFTMPWSTTRAFPHPLVNLSIKDDTTPVPMANYVSYLAVEWMTWQGLGDVINAWRKSLELEMIPRSEGPGLAETLKIPFTYCWSNALVPRPEDWPSWIDVCGFFFREEPSYIPDAELAKFLASGRMPIYIGFGSIVVDDPYLLTKTLIEAVKWTGERAIISKGWSKLGAMEENDPNIFYLDDCPHEWLFKRVSLVVHHGGAGTTACGIVNQKPTVIVPFFGDQPFWGKMVHAAGAGPKPIPHKQLNSQNLAQGIQHCLLPGTKAAVAFMAAQMRERGVEAAANSFHSRLPIENLRCDLISGHVASWEYKKGRARIKISKAAAEILTQHSVIKWSQLQLYETKPVDIVNSRWDPITATASSLADTGIGMVTSAANIVVKPALSIHSAARSRKGDSGDSDTGISRVRTTASSLGTEANNDSGQQLANLSSVKKNHFVEAVKGSAEGVGGVLHHFYKGMLVDMPLAATEGLRAVPKLYGGEVRDFGPVKDWKSGFTVAGKTFSHSMGEGFLDLIKEPVKGGQRDGVLGAVKGVGKGVVNMTTKVSSGVLGLVAYPGQGLTKSIVTAANSKTRNTIRKAVQQEGVYRMLALESRDMIVGQVMQRFEDILQNR